MTDEPGLAPAFFVGAPITVVNAPRLKPSVAMPPVPLFAPVACVRRAVSASSVRRVARVYTLRTYHGRQCGAVGAVGGFPGLARLADPDRVFANTESSRVFRPEIQSWRCVRDYG